MAQGHRYSANALKRTMTAVINGNATANLMRAVPNACGLRVLTSELQRPWLVSHQERWTTCMYAS